MCDSPVSMRVTDMLVITIFFNLFLEKLINGRKQGHIIHNAKLPIQFGSELRVNIFERSDVKLCFASFLNMTHDLYY